MRENEPFKGVTFVSLQLHQKSRGSGTVACDRGRSTAFDCIAKVAVSIRASTSPNLMPVTAMFLVGWLVKMALK